MANLETEYAMRLGRVGAVVLGAGVLMYFVLQAQQRASAPTTGPSDEGESVPVILLENATIREVDEEVEQAARPRDDHLSAIADSVTADLRTSTTQAIDLPREALPLPGVPSLERPALPEIKLGQSDPYISSSKSISFPPAEDSDAKPPQKRPDRR